ATSRRRRLCTCSWCRRRRSTRMSPRSRPPTPTCWRTSSRSRSVSPPSTPTATTGSYSTPVRTPAGPSSTGTPTCAPEHSRKARLADGLEPNGSSPRAEQGHAELEVDGVAMVRLLGPQDRLLTTLEHQYPEVEVLVRGNRVNLDG